MLSRIQEKTRRDRIDSALMDLCIPMAADEILAVAKASAWRGRRSGDHMHFPT